MGQIWVKQFASGLDVRRMPETTPAGALLRCVDCHINRGGEIEQRAAFTKLPALPAGTVGLAYDATSLVVFGSATTPAGMPAGVRYQRLQNPNNLNATLVSVPSFDLFASKLYVVGVFDDTTIVHFYDGVAVTFPSDGRARVAIRVVSGASTSGTLATGSCDVTLVSGGAGTGVVANVTVNGVDVTNGPFSVRKDTTANAAADIAARINATTSNPDYTASVSGATVTISAVAAGVAPNGFVVSGSGSADITLGAFVNMSGGVDPVPDTLATMAAGGVSLTAGAVSWTTNAAAMATSIAAAINTKTVDTGYSAKALGDRVSIQYNTVGTAKNGTALTTTKTGTLVLDPASGAFFSGGLATGSVVQPGKHVATIDEKMYTGNQTLLVFSGVGQPTSYSTSTPGAGFIDFANQAAGAGELQTIAPFQQYGAIFAQRSIFVWFLDPDPTLNRKAQVLKNTGAVSARSVTQFGDSDLFYLDRTGVRSVRARFSTTAASTTDIGVLIDPLVQAQLLALTTAERERIFGLIEPADGRFWLVMKNKIFVFSLFPGSKISAWSEYIPVTYAAGVATQYNIDEAVVFLNKVYLRSGNDILVYGGESETLVYDETQPDVWTAYLDAEKPALPKRTKAIDVACEGLWDVAIAADLANTATVEPAVRVWQTTFNMASVPMEVEGSHFSVRFKGVPGKTGPRKIGALCIHYDGDDPAEQK